MTSDLRNRELAAIHCAKRDLGLDDETYRLMLEQVAGVLSSRELDEAGRRKVLDHLRTKGAPKSKAHPGKPHNFDIKPELAKIEALLAEAKREWAYADGIARNMFGVERCAWLTPDQLRAVLTALVKDAQKHGRRTR